MPPTGPEAARDVRRHRSGERGSRSGGKTVSVPGGVAPALLEGETGGERDHGDPDYWGGVAGRESDGQPNERNE